MNCCSLPALFRSQPTWQPTFSPLTDPWLAPLQPLDSYAPSSGLGYLLANEDLALGWLMMALSSAAPAPAFDPATTFAPPVKQPGRGLAPHRSQPHPQPAPWSRDRGGPAGDPSEIGMRARNFNGSRPGGWGGWCLSWVRNAVEFASGKGERGISLLNASSAEEARQQAARAGVLRKGNPPPGAIVYWKPGTFGADSKYGHIAIANPDGKTYRGSSSAFGGREVGDQRFPPGARANLYWTMPEWLIHPERGRK